MLNLDDLGIEATEPPRRSPYATPTPTAVPTEEAVPDDGMLTLRDADAASKRPAIADLVRALGVAAATRCLGDAVHQIWGRRPEAMPGGAVLAAADYDGDPVAALDFLLRLRLPDHTSLRVIALARRHGDQWLVDHAAWDAIWADEGVAYPEMERRAFFGEIDSTGPRESRFDLATMTFPAERDRALTGVNETCHR